MEYPIQLAIVPRYDSFCIGRSKYIVHNAINKSLFWHLARNKYPLESTFFRIFFISNIPNLPYNLVIILRWVSVFYQFYQNQSPKIQENLDYFKE